MDKPDVMKYFKDYFVSDIENWSILQQAKAEIEYERFREAVEKKKIELLTYKPWYEKLFPYRINIERIK